MDNISNSTDMADSDVEAAKWSREATQRKSLEDEQSAPAERQRSLREGDEARLTELAVHQPVSEQENKDDLERHESLVKESSGSTQSFDRNIGALAEVAAPAPVEEDDTSQGHGRPNQEISSEERVASSSTEGGEKAEGPATRQGLSLRIEIVTVAWLIFFSLLGTLGRIGSEAIATYPNAVIPSTVLWANMGGSFFLGFLLEDRRFFRHSAPPHLLTDDKELTHHHIDKSKKAFPLYIGLATGFCGSFTSFSTFIVDAFLALSNGISPPNPQSPYHVISPELLQPRNGGYSLMAVLAIVILHPAVSVCALKTGAHLAIGLESVTPTLPSGFISKFSDPIAILLGFGCWLGAVFLSIWPVENEWRRQATMALVFAPPGVLLRFYISRLLNARIPAFPLGTFAVNIFGTCVEGMCYDLQHTNSIIGGLGPAGANTCAVFEGVMQGFCGCATTVSTWVAELNGLRRRHGWLYGLASVGTALGFQIAIMGSVAWTAGFDQICGVKA